MSGGVIIIGAGVAGAILASALRSYDPEVYEASAPKEVFSDHKAVMRMRHPHAGLIIGADVEEINIHKMVYIGKNLTDKASITANNMYAMKVYGTLADRSVMELGLAKRYIVVGDTRVKDVRNGYKLDHIERMLGGDMCAVFKDSTGETRRKYDFCFSTIPMPAMIRIAGEKKYFDIKFKSSSVYITRAKLLVDSAVHQTIYFPEPRFNAYRATIEGCNLIVEAIDEVPEEELEEILELFGITSRDIGNKSYYVQTAGKLGGVDDDMRRLVIMDLTVGYGIYSFGRYAIWRPVRVDHLVEDMTKIKSMMRLSDTKRRYTEKLQINQAL